MDEGHRAEGQGAHDGDRHSVVASARVGIAVGALPAADTRQRAQPEPHGDALGDGEVGGQHGVGTVETFVEV